MTANWNNRDIADLKAMIRQGRSLKEAATVLDRRIADIQAILHELGSRMPGSNALIKGKFEDGAVD